MQIIWNLAKHLDVFISSSPFIPQLSDKIKINLQLITTVLNWIWHVTNNFILWGRATSKLIFIQLYLAQVSCH